MVRSLTTNALLPEGDFQVWMSHGDRIELPPEGFETLASSSSSPHAAIGNSRLNIFGLQFHPEVYHTPQGAGILGRFALDICREKPDWTANSIITQSIADVRQQVGGKQVISAVSGGVDSSVATALVQKAVPEQLVSVFVDTGFMRQDEVRLVQNNLQHSLEIELIVEDASDRFFEALAGISDPEKKRRIIGGMFISVFESAARELGSPPFLVQGTIYPDVVESSAPDRSKAERIKSHHNVGGLPDNMDFQLVEPLRYLFKDEVRLVGEELGLPSELIWRQPFPGPGLAVRCLGEITRERIEILRKADNIFVQALMDYGLMKQRRSLSDPHGIAQAFAVLLPVRSVGVMGDQRTYQETVALRAVTSEDFMTADWARLDSELMAQVSNRIVNEIEGVNRVVYDITSKPPATIEWE
jgi:GMP synthase (glutamine-hydrolysing)